MPPATAVMVVGPVRIYRESLAGALSCQGRLEVLGAAASLPEVFRRTEVPKPDVILLDASCRCTVRGLPAAARAGPAVGLVAVAVPEDDDVIVFRAAAGVVGFVAREATLDEIVVAAEAVARGGVACTPGVAAALLRRFGAGAHSDRSDTSSLTVRERQILGLIDDGMSNKEIADRLYIEVSTVKNHVHHILMKLGARRRSEAAAQARYRPSSVAP